VTSITFEVIDHLNFVSTKTSINLNPMKINNHLAIITICTALFCPLAGHATPGITATNSGNWGDPTIWEGGIVPGTNVYADIPLGINVTVTTNAYVQYLQDLGTVTMAPNSTLYVVGDTNGAHGTFELGLLDTSATGNTVVFSGNAFWAMHQNYYNLVFNGGGNFYNGEIGEDFYNDGAFAMTIAGNMTVAGHVGLVQEGDDITVNGDLNLGGPGVSNFVWDCSSFNLNVHGNTIIGNGAKITDYDGAHGNDNFNNLTVNSGGTLYILDSTNWYVLGNLTNAGGSLYGIGFAQINFDGTGNITGSSFTLPTFNMTGTYTIGTTINCNTNTPGLNGTLVFDLANPGQLTVAANAATGPTFYYSTSGNLDVINSGPSPAPGANFQFFNAQSYAGNFASISLPSLPSGLSWVNNLATSGSITVLGSLPGPVLTLSRNGGQLTLSWNSATYPGYEVLAQTNKTGLGGTWTAVGSGTVSPYMVTINPANPPVYFRLSNP
jgi:hypothetical protein